MHRAKILCTLLTLSLVISPSLMLASLFIEVPTSQPKTGLTNRDTGT
jgi:hypothetical protein